MVLGVTINFTSKAAANAILDNLPARIIQRLQYLYLFSLACCFVWINEQTQNPSNPSEDHDLMLIGIIGAIMYGNLFI